MTIKHLPGGRRVLAGAAALAVGFVGFGSATYADPALAPGNIQMPGSGASLTIHKHIDGTQTPQGTPDGKTQVDGTGVEGVQFTLHPITNLDLTTQAAWNGLKDMPVPADACNNTVSLKLPNDANPSVYDKPATFGTPVVSGLTAADGTVKVSGLEIKGYLVCETKAPANIVQKAAPFFVTIPFPNNAANAANGDGEWLYDVHVYPKNKPVDKPTKDVVVSNNGLVNEGQLTYTVSQKVPGLGAGYSFKYFIIGDKMSAGQDAEPSNVDSVKLNDGTELGYTTKKGADGKLYVSLNHDALETLKTKAGETVIVTFKTKATQVGLLDNWAQSFISSIPGDTPPTPPEEPPAGEEPQPTNKVFSSWGDLIIEKHDQDNQKKLAGATFEVYNAKAAYDGTCTKELEGNALVVNGKSKFTTGVDGTVKIDGLFVDQGKAAQKVAEGKPVFEADGTTPVYDDPTWDHNNTHRCYVIKETAAPAGYTLPTGDKALTAVKVTPGETASGSFDAEVPNVKQNVPQLPLTGANGQLLMTIGGASLILIAAGATLVARRRAQD